MWLQRGCARPHIILGVLRDLVKPPPGRPRMLVQESPKWRKVSPLWWEAPMAGNKALLVQEKNIFPRAGESSHRTENHHYRNDIHEVIFPQGVQNGCDGVLGDSHPQPLHAPTHVHQNHYVFGRGGRLYVP